MQIFPATKEAWSRVAMLFFKAYVLLAYFAMQLYLAALPRRRDADSELFMLAIFGYMICFVVLCCESKVHNQAGRTRASVVSLLLGLLSGVFGYLLLPDLSR